MKKPTKEELIDRMLNRIKPRNAKLREALRTELSSRLMSHGIELVGHKMPTGEQMRAEIDRKIKAGEPLGASHVPEIKPGAFGSGSLAAPIQYSRLAPSHTKRWMTCPGSVTKKGNPK